MAGFGGAVKLTGESEYKKALAQITQSLKEVSSEMSLVSSQYDKNDKSLEATSSKTEVLTKKLEEQQKKVTILKDQYASMLKQYQEQTTKHDDLVKSYENEKQKLETIGKELGTTSKEYEEQEKVVNGLKKEVDQSTKAQEANQKSLSDMRIQLNNAERDANNTSKEIDKLGDETEKSGKKAKEAGEGGYTVFKNVIANLTTKVITGAIDGLKKLGSAFIDLGKQAVSGFADMEQLSGGVQKLFGEDDAKTVIANAQKAFGTAGMTANEYMETVTNFSASLIAGLDGDTAKATQIADMAIQDMADNANVFGTSIESIQSAYSGFAKGNFSMLDSLKLGYGGTKSEMLRLVKEAGVVDESIESLDDVSFDQMIEAIHIVQENMNITGTTAKEASKTVSGSVGAMRSAWSNLVTGMADENSNFEELASNFINTLITPDGEGGVLGQLLPRIAIAIEGIGNAINALLPQLVQTVIPVLMDQLPVIISAVQTALQAIVSVIPEVIPLISAMVPMLVSTLISLLPDIISAGIQLMLGLLQGLSDAIPQLVAMLPEIIDTICSTLIDNIGLIVDAGIDLLMGLLDGIMEALPDLIDRLPEIVINMVNKLLEQIPKIIDAGIKLLISLVDNMPKIIDGIVKALPRLITGLIQGLMDNLPKIIDAGVRLIVALVQNVPAIISGIVKAIPQIIKGLIDSILSFLPKLAEVGKNLLQGVWNGLKNAGEWLWSKIKGLFSGILSKIKSFFGIHSPSTVFRDQIGENLALGLGEGFTDTMDDVTREMQDSIPTAFDVNPSINASMNGGTGSINSYDNMVQAFKDALGQVKIVIDDEVAGTFVDKTVTQLIYA